MNRIAFSMASPRGVAHDGAILWTRLGRRGQAVHPDLRGADVWRQAGDGIRYGVVYHIYRYCVYVYIIIDTYIYILYNLCIYTLYIYIYTYIICHRD